MDPQQAAMLKALAQQAPQQAQAGSNMNNQMGMNQMSSPYNAAMAMQNSPMAGQNQQAMQPNQNSMMNALMQSPPAQSPLLQSQMAF